MSALDDREIRYEFDCCRGYPSRRVRCRQRMKLPDMWLNIVMGCHAGYMEQSATRRDSRGELVMIVVHNRML